MVDGDMQNTLVERYRALSSRHLLAPQLSELATDSVLLTTETVHSHTRIAVAMRTNVGRDDVAVAADYRLDLRIGHDIAVDMTADQTVTLEKVAIMFTGRDHGVSEPATEAVRRLNRIERYADLEYGHLLDSICLMGRDPHKK